ncbi:MAG: GTPase ObgE [Mycoplasmataceae bacterium]|nr:GTPase ObgE [Mycoplasmataceae bacterium]
MKQITFIDQAKIKIKAGRGGDGKMGFHKEKYVEQGGPSGGHGGNGGSIFFRATINENTLLNYKGKSQYKGNNGTNGGLKNMTGAKGKDIYLDVPVGTEVQDLEGNKISDLQFDGQIWLASQGGKGGRGNKSFRSSKNTTPTLFEYGEEPDWIEFMLNLKVLADVGLLGYPNAGKSTLVSSITNAKPKIANYEFTTLNPQLGVVGNKASGFVITDLPGLIAGASEDKGMGMRFLKHLSRTRLIIHLIDATKDNLLKRYNALRKELKSYSENLNNRPEMIIFSKSDLIDEEIKSWIKDEFKNKKVYFISSLTRDGLKDIIDIITEKLEIIKDKEKKDFEDLLTREDEFEVFSLKEEEDPLLIEHQDGIWTISNKYTKFWANRIPLASSENIWRLISKFRSKGIIEKLKNTGIKDGDILVVKDSPFVLDYKGD